MHDMKLNHFDDSFFEVDLNDKLIFNNVVNVVCSVTKINRELVMRRRKNRIVNIIPRHIIFYILRCGYGWNLQKIGDSFSKYENIKAFNHATILYGVRVIKNDMISDKYLKARLIAIQRALGFSDDLLTYDCVNN